MVRVVLIFWGILEVIVFLVALAQDIILSIFIKDREYGLVGWYVRWAAWTQQRQIKKGDKSGQGGYRI